MKKGYSILIIVFVVYVGITITVKMIHENNIKYLIFPDGQGLKYESKWNEIDSTQLPNKRYTVINNGKKEIESKLTISEDIHIGNQLLEGEMYAYRGANINHLEYINDQYDESDYQYSSNVLEELNIKVDLRSISYLNKYRVDLNNDKIDEEIYIVTNHYDTEIGQLFSLIYIKTIEGHYILEFEKFENEFAAYLPYIYILDIDNNGFGDIVVKNRYASMMGQKIKIISFQSDLKEYKTIYEGGLK